MAVVNLINGHHYKVSCLRNLILTNGAFIDVKNVIYVRDKFTKPITNIGRIVYNSDSITLIDNNGAEVETFPRALSTSSLYPANTNGIVFEVIATNYTQNLDDTYIYDISQAVSLGNYYVAYFDETTSPQTKTANVIINGDNRGHENIEIVASDLVSFPLRINLENIDDTSYSFYKNKIRVTLNFDTGNLFSEWDERTDITSLCEIGENYFIIPACVFNYDDYLFYIKNHLLTDTNYVLFGGVDGIQLLAGQNEVYRELNWGESLTIELTIPNYHFTENSYELIKNWITELFTGIDESGNVYNELERATSGYKVLPDEDGGTTKAYIVFSGIYNDIDSEDFNIFESTPTTLRGKSVTDLELNRDYRLVDTDLIGCTLEQIEEEITYKQRLRYRIVVNDGYYDGNFLEIHVYRNGVDLLETSEAFEDDGIIYINEAYGDVSIVVHCSLIYTIRFYNGNELITRDVPQKITISLTKTNEANQYKLDMGIGGFDVFELANVTDFDRLVGIRTLINSFLIPVGIVIPEFNLENYADENHIVTFNNVIKSQLHDVDIDMYLYQFNGEKTLVDKTNKLTFISKLSGTLRESCSFISPIMTISLANAPTFNYVYIPNFNRYYFVTDITNVRNGLWNISLKVDVLMTYRVEISTQRCIVARNEFEFNNMIEDTQRLVEKEEKVEVTTFSDKTNPFTYTGSETGVAYGLNQNNPPIVINVIRGIN